MLNSPVGRSGTENHVDLQICQAGRWFWIIEQDFDLHDTGVFSRRRIGAYLVLFVYFRADPFDAAAERCVDDRPVKSAVRRHLDILKMPSRLQELVT